MACKIEGLIRRYERAIFRSRDPELIERLSNEVEREADKVGYDNHRRLMGLHTAAERVCMQVSR